MKKLFMTLFAIFIFGTVFSQTNPATEVADKIAVKMRDSLSLSDSAKNAIYNINMFLHSEKMSARQQFGATDSLGRKIQQVENTRDSLYRNVLNEEKFQLYIQKKRNLISNNQP